MKTKTEVVIGAAALGAVVVGLLVWYFQPGDAVKRIYPAGFTKVSSLGVEQQRVKVIVGFEPEALARLRTEQNLGVGYQVRVRIITERKPQSLVIPRSALFRGADGGWQVQVLRGDRPRDRGVKIGLMNDDRAEVLSGLIENERVVRWPESI